jgi:signal transduction histidine kinase
MALRWPAVQRGDWLPPVLLGVAATVEVLAVDPEARAAAIGTALLACALLVWRRRYPLVCATAAGLVLLVVSMRLGVPDDALTVPLLILFAVCFSLGRYVPSWWGAVAVAGLNLSLHWSDGVVVPPLDDVLWAGTLFFAPYGIGRLVHAHDRQGDQLADQARQLVVEQRQVAERAVADERRRIARELHDVIAHSISVMVVQAGAARELLGRDEEGVASSLDEIQRSGRAALGETGRLLGLLREEPATDVEPQPSATDIPRLVEDFRGSGLDVALDLDGSTDGLPAGLDLSLYRIVEEGLTNALKHTPGTKVAVHYRRTADRVEVELTSAASRESSRIPSGGHGLVGMRERAAVFGGSVTAGPTADGGFLVSARLPLGEPA